MNSILVVLLVLAMIAAVVALVRGIIAFLRTTDAELRRDPQLGPSPSSLRQNRMMWRRIQFQGLAVVVVVLILLLAHPHG
jgi:hypothetical protein